jgi:hypothetical protein
MGFGIDGRPSQGVITVLVTAAVLAVVLSGTVPVHRDDLVRAAPNPIPILSLSLSPSQLEAHVTDTELGAVTFTGNATVEQLQLMSSTVTLQAVVNTGWPVVLSPQTIPFDGPGTEKFYVTVIVPPATSSLETGTVIVTGNCKAPGLAPIVASASAVVTVDLDIIEGEFSLFINEPLNNQTLKGDTFEFKGTSSYSRGDIIEVRIQIDNSQWFLAYGTSEWSYKFNLTSLPIGYHTLSVVTDSEYFTSNRTSISFKVERDPIDTVTGGSENPGDGWGNLSGFVAAVIVVGVIVCVSTVITIVLFRTRPERS